MKEAYANNDAGGVEQCARCWVQIAPENPFKYDTPEYEEFFQMKKCYSIWAKGDVSRKINRRRMVQHAMTLCAMNPRQPYTYDKKAEQEELRLAELAKKEEEERKLKEAEAKKVVIQEPQVVLGVIPDEEKEKKPWFKFLRPWKKEGVSDDGK